MEDFFDTFACINTQFVRINKDTIILGIESSCDETSAAVIVNGKLRSNFIANQSIHERFGGVVPELASRAHQQNIIPVIDTAIREAGIDKKAISAVAFTRGPGLMGALLVGTSFAKSFALSLNIPLVEVHHMQAHILAHFVRRENDDRPLPEFPFLCLTVSGGHTQLVVVHSPLNMEIIGETIDDAAGEAFDKSAKIMGLPYPGGPLIDKLAKEGNPEAFKFTHPQIAQYDYSFSGLKTNILYFLQQQQKENPDFIEQHKNDLCASIQHTIISILMHKLRKAAKDKGIQHIAIAGGVSANSGLRKTLMDEGDNNGWTLHIPPFEYCTDNAAMIAQAGLFRYEAGMFASIDIAPLARIPF
jgi:N6-L-threonylcarbamoyladenine synthase